MKSWCYGFLSVVRQRPYTRNLRKALMTIKRMHLRTGTLLFAAMIGLSLLAAPAANALGRTGCSLYGPVVSKAGISIPIKGSYCAEIDIQSGTSNGLYKVNWVKGWFTGLDPFGIAKVCNRQYTAEFFDTSGRWYSTIESGIVLGCSRDGLMSIPINKFAKPGLMCSTLRSQGTRVTSVCHSIPWK
jgi:hypothetical protein